MLNLESFTLIAIYSLALRWTLFRYILFRGVREWLRSLNFPLLNKLLLCTFCQGVEAAVVVQVSLWVAGCQFNLIEAGLASLSIGWIAILTDAIAEEAIEKMEQLHDFPLEERE